MLELCSNLKFKLLCRPNQEGIMQALSAVMAHGEISASAPG